MLPQVETVRSSKLATLCPSMWIVVRLLPKWTTTSIRRPNRWKAAFRSILSRALFPLYFKARSRVERVILKVLTISIRTDVGNKICRVMIYNSICIISRILLVTMLLTAKIALLMLFCFIQRFARFVAEILLDPSGIQTFNSS